MTPSYPPTAPPRYQLKHTNAGPEGTRCWAVFTTTPGQESPEILVAAMPEPGHSAHQVMGAKRWATEAINNHLDGQQLPFAIEDLLQGWSEPSPGIYIPGLHWITWEARLATVVGVFTLTSLTRAEVSKIKMAVLSGTERIEIKDQVRDISPEVLARQLGPVGDSLFLLSRHIIAENYTQCFERVRDGA